MFATEKNSGEGIVLSAINFSQVCSLMGHQMICQKCEWFIDTEYFFSSILCPMCGHFDFEVLDWPERDGLGDEEC